LQGHLWEREMVEEFIPQQQQQQEEEEEEEEAET
jgi:hypothetical protein